MEVCGGGGVGVFGAPSSITHHRARERDEQESKSGGEEVRAPARQHQTSHCSNTTRSLLHSLLTKLGITLS